MDGDYAKRRRRGITLELQQVAWQLRNQMTPAEKIMWEALRDHRLAGLRFRRQHPVGQFVLDFYCALHKLVIEIDGSVHDTSAEQDFARTAYLNAYGYQVVRFRNEEVLTNLSALLERIVTAANSVSPIIGG